MVLVLSQESDKSTNDVMDWRYGIITIFKMFLLVSVLKTTYIIAYMTVLSLSLRLSLLSLLLTLPLMIFGQETKLASPSLDNQKAFDLSIGISGLTNPTFRIEYDKRGSNRRKNYFLELNSIKSYSNTINKQDSIFSIPCLVDRYLTKHVTQITIGKSFYSDKKSNSVNGFSLDIGFAGNIQHYNYQNITWPLEFYLIGQANYRYYLIDRLYVNASIKLLFGFRHQYLNVNEMRISQLFLPDLDLRLLNFRVGYQF